MKFSIKLFKIQTKISVSSLILSGVVGGAVAMAGDELENGSRLPQASHVLAGVYDSPLQKSGGLASRLSYDSDVSDSPVTPVSQNTRVTLRPNGAFVSRVVAPEGFKPRTCGKTGLAASFKKQLIMSPEKFGQAISASQGVVNARKILERYKKKKASMPSQEVQTDDLLELDPFSVVVDRYRTAVNHSDSTFQDPSAEVLHSSPAKFQRQVDMVLEEGVGEILPSGVRLRMEQQERRSFSNEGVLVQQKLDFSEESALALRDNSSVFLSDPLFSASNQDQITLQIQKGSEVVDVVTTMADLLKPVELSDANDKLTVVRLYFQYLSSDEKGREKKIKKIQDRYPNIFGNEVLFAHLQSEAIAAFSTIPDFLLNLVRQSKQDKAALVRFAGGARDVYSYVAGLEEKNTRLTLQADKLRESMQSSFQAFNSAFSVFGLTLRHASDVDGAVVSQVQTTYRRLSEDHQRLEVLYRENCENYAELLKANTSYLKKMDEDRALIQALYDEKRELQRQLDSAESRESAWKQREEELLRTIESLREEKRMQSNKSKGTVPSHLVKKKGNF